MGKGQSRINQKHGQQIRRIKEDQAETKSNVGALIDVTAQNSRDIRMLRAEVDELRTRLDAERV